MAGFSESAHWRDSARVTRFWIFDATAAFPLVLFLLHIRWWSFIVAVLTMIFLSILSRYGFTVPIFLRWLRSTLAGPRKFAIPWWRE
jgi:intracellular multiplication protein IcmT